MQLRLSTALAALAAACVLVLSAPVRAQDDSLNRAREAFDKAQSLFESGKYSDAAAQFEAAYQARPFAQFLFNIGACYEKMRDYQKAADYYRRYLKAEPNAPDSGKTQKRIAALDKAVAEVKAAGQAGTPATGTDTTGATGTPATGTDATGATGTTTGTTAPAQPPAAMVGLEDPTPHGLVVVESEPQGATIYLDSKRSKPLSKTPWNGTLDGEHLIMLEREGYKPVERRITPDPHKLLVLFWGLAEEDYLGWIRITSNPPGASIYIDDRSAGVYQHTPYQGNLTPGTHKIWISAEGYDDFYRQINIVAGQPHNLDAHLKGSPVGYLNIRGGEVDKMSVYVDGKEACHRGPCRFAVHQGSHDVAVKREGYKTYHAHLDMQAKTEVTLRAQLAEQPSRKDAVVAYVFAALFAGGGVWAGLQAKHIQDDLQKDIDAGAPPPSKDDPRFLRGKVYAAGADAAFVLGGVSLLAAIYYTVRDKGPASTGSTDVRVAGPVERAAARGHAQVAFDPQIGPGYAGLGMEVRW